MTENGQKRGDLGSSPRSGVCTGQSEVSDRLSRTGLREKTLTVRFQFHHKEIRAGRFSLSVSGFTARHRPTRHARSFHATSAHAPFMRHNKRAALPSPGRQPRPVGLTPSPGSGPGGHPPGRGHAQRRTTWLQSLSALGLGLAGQVALGVVLVVASGAGAALARVGHLTA